MFSRILNLLFFVLFCDEVEVFNQDQSKKKDFKYGDTIVCLFSRNKNFKKICRFVDSGFVKTCDEYVIYTKKKTNFRDKSPTVQLKKRSYQKSYYNYYYYVFAR